MSHHDQPDASLLGGHALFRRDWLYITCARGFGRVDIDDPLQPQIVGELTGDFLKNPRAIAVQFRYAFVTDEEGLKVIDITEPTNPPPFRRRGEAQNAQRFYIAALTLTWRTAAGIGHR